MSSLKVIVMAGGKGERFWPRSRRARPKQFAKIVSSETMVGETLARFDGFVPRENLFISTGAVYEPLVRECLPDFPAKNILIEPMGRDTAAAVCLSALASGASDEDILFFIPADHFIGDVKAYRENILTACEVLKREKAMVLLGIPPDSPSENYGYIQTNPGKDGIFSVAGFREKPDRKTAETYLASGNYFWNAGMFFFTGRMIKDLFRDLAPDHLKKIEEYLRLVKTDKKKAEEIFASIEKISFDYAIVEKTKNLFCVKASFPWDDVGSWNAVARLKDNDAAGNVFSGSVASHGTQNVTVYADRKDLTFVLNGVENLNIIADGNVVYITHKDKENDIKILLKNLEKEKPELL